MYQRLVNTNARLTERLDETNARVNERAYETNARMTARVYETNKQLEEVQSSIVCLKCCLLVLCIIVIALFIRLSK